IFTTDLPKTRSGKIMRRLLRDVARGHPLGDVTTLANAEIVEQSHETLAAGVGIAASLIVPVAVAARAFEPAGPSGCTISGTNGNDVLRGTASRDVICGRNGGDALVGLGGDDRGGGGGGSG